MWVTATAFGVGTAMLLSACGSTTGGAEDSPAEAGAEPGTEGSETIEVEDNFGTHTLTLPLESVVATDNRTFRTLDDWGVELSAAAVSLMPPEIGRASCRERVWRSVVAAAVREKSMSEPEQTQ